MISNALLLTLFLGSAFGKWKFAGRQASNPKPTDFKTPSEMKNNGKYYGRYSDGSASNWPIRNLPYDLNANLSQILPKITGQTDIIGLVMNFTRDPRFATSTPLSISTYCDPNHKSKAYRKLGCLWALMADCPFSSDGRFDHCDSSSLKYLDDAIVFGIKESQKKISPKGKSCDDFDNTFAQIIKAQASSLAKKRIGPFDDDFELFAYILFLAPDSCLDSNSDTAQAIITLHQTYLKVSRMTKLQLEIYLNATLISKKPAKRALSQSTSFSTQELLDLCPLDLIADQQNILAGCMSGVVNLCVNQGNLYACKFY